MALGMTEQDRSAWYRIFSTKRLDYGKASEIVFRESLERMGEDELYVVGGDWT